MLVTSRSLMTCPQLRSDLGDYFVLRPGIHAAFFHFLGAAVNYFLPQLFGIGIHPVVQTRDKLVSQIGSVSFGQDKQFGDFLSG